MSDTTPTVLQAGESTSIIVMHTDASMSNIDVTVDDTGHFDVIIDADPDRPYSVITRVAPVTDVGGGGMALLDEVLAVAGQLGDGITNGTTVSGLRETTDRLAALTAAWKTCLDEQLAPGPDTP